jgi:Beta-lactamase
MDAREGGLAAALNRITGVDIDVAAARAHVLRPDYLLEATSDQGLERAPVKVLPVPPLPVPPFYVFDAPGFIHSLKEQLTGNVAGYSIRLTESGWTIGQATQNWSKEPQDGARAWTPDTRMHVASLSKTVTAIAMTRLLGERGISLNEPIIGYLPDYWTKGPGVDQITFAELMAHTSGLAFGSGSSQSDFAYMKAQIAAGTTHSGQYSYQNLNYGLCRILLATASGNIPVDLIFPPLLGADVNDQFWDFAAISVYKWYVANCVFAPAGVTGPGFTHEAADALAYNFPVTGNGWNSQDLTSMAGAAGWHMSVNEFLKVMATFRRSDTIVTSAQAQAMLDNGFGLNRPVVQTHLGSVYHKIGAWHDGASQWEQCVAFFLPLQMELVILVNSPVGEHIDEGFLYELVSNTYIAHIVTERPPVKL